MGKKIMLIATLVGVLSLGACVDDKESPSVEKIRNAKAEQLSSLAKLNLADADATALLAAADAALKNADAELKKIEAEQAKVLVEQAKVQLELDKVELEQAKADLAYDAEEKKIQLAQLQVSLETQQATLESQKLALEQQKALVAVELAGQEQKLETALLQAQKDLIDAKNSYQASLTSADNAERTRLQTLLNTYTSAVSTLNTYKSQLAGYQRDLIGLEFDLVTAEEVKKTTITDKEEQIAYKKAQKEIYESYGADRVGAKTALDKARLELQVLEDAQWATILKKDEVSTKRNNVIFELDNSVYRTILSDLFYSGKNYGDKTIQLGDYDSENQIFYYYYNVTDKGGVTKPVRLYSSSKTISTTVERIENNRSYSYDYPTYTYYYTVEKAGLDSLVAAYEAYIGTHQQASVTTAEAAYNAAVLTETATKAKAELAAATPADKQAYQEAYNDRVNKENTLNYAKDALKIAQDDLAKVKEAAAYVTGEGQEAVKALVDSYNALSKEYAELYVQSQIDDHAVSLKRNEVTALETIHNDAGDIVNNIKYANFDIATLEKEIATYSEVVTKEDAIKAKKIEIANTEAKIALKEKEVAAAKAAFEAATGEE
jgi:chromosome segregation ATPase